MMGYLAALLIVVAGLGQEQEPPAPEPEAENQQEGEAAPAAEESEEPELAPLVELEPAEEIGELETLEPPDQAKELETLEPPGPANELETPESIETPKTWLKYPPGTVLYVNASSLALRKGPRRDATLVHFMPSETRVVAIEDVIDSVPEKVGSREGHWVFMRQGQHEGYVFDAYLVQAPPSMDESLDWLCEPGKRVGPITAKTTLEELMSFFGEANVREARIPLQEGEAERGTVIFSEDPERRLFIRWKYHNVSPSSVIVEGKRWHTTKGFGIGSRLSEIVRANDGPVSFAGFGWDYAGYVMSWRGGTLEADHRLRDDISIFLAPEQPYLPADFQALQGDREFSSEQPEAAKLNLHVNAMTIMLHE